jgi:hypothetical protein
MGSSAGIARLARSVHEIRHGTKGGFAVLRTSGMLREARRVTWLAPLGALGLVAAFNGPATAQDVKMQRTPLERELGIIPPATQPARSRPSDADYYPNTGGIIQEPAFFEALSAKTETGRYGIAGWSSPNSPAGADSGEINGWLSFGFAFTWASPATSPRRPKDR